MNYFAHGRAFIDDPYFLAGTALPDWLSVVDRKVRARSKRASALLRSENAHLARMAAGVVQHHTDDAWFHKTPAFGELSWEFTRLVRDSLPADDTLRPSFLGHILVELLLDASLIELAPDRLTAYYSAVEKLDPMVITWGTEQLTGRTASRVVDFVYLFSCEQFLWDYHDDGKLLFRLNQVMRRVRLPTLSPSFCSLLPKMRSAVEGRCDDLLAIPGELPCEYSQSPRTTTPE